MSESSPSRRDELYIDGMWRSGDDTIAVRDLTTDGTVGEIAAATPAQAETALAAAEAAQPAMRETTPVERAEWLEAIADEIEARAETLVDTIVREAGKPISSARGAPAAAAERFRRAAAEARELAVTQTTTAFQAKQPSTATNCPLADTVTGFCHHWMSSM
ncbi:MAG: aldehyde dehydrogenase family protein [Halohasta sp.]